MTKRSEEELRRWPQPVGPRICSRLTWVVLLGALLASTAADGEEASQPTTPEAPSRPTPPNPGAASELEQSELDSPLGPDSAVSDPRDTTNFATRQPPTEPKQPPIEVRLSLQDAIRLAVKNNLQLRTARLDDAIRQREIVIARAAFDPLFNVGSTYAKNRDPTVSFLDVGTGAVAAGVSTNPAEIESHSAGLGGTWLTGTTYDVSIVQIEADRPASEAGGITSLNPVTQTHAFVDVRQPLLQGAWYTVNSADIRLAQNSLKLSREELERIMVETVFLVEQTYWDLVFATQNRVAAEKTFAVTTEDLRNSEQRLAVGSFSENDLKTVKTQWLVRKIDLEAARQAVETARDAVLGAINYSGIHSLKTAWELQTPEGNYNRIEVICTTGATDVSVPGLTRDEALGLAFQHRADYRQLETQVANQKIRIDVARNTLLPNLDLLGRWTQLGLENSHKDSFSSLGSGKFYDWLVGVELAIPLSRRGARASLRNARSALRQIALQKQELENQIVINVNQSIRSLKSLASRLVDLEEEVRLRVELVEDERLKLNVGSSTAYNVSLVENDLILSQTEALRMRADLQIARASFYRAVGRLLVEHKLWMD